MEKEKFSVGDIDRMGDLKIKGIIKLVIERNKDIAKLAYDNSNKESLEEDFKLGIFSNMKPKIVESLAEEMGIDNPGSKEAWNEVIEKYPEDKLRELMDEIAKEELKSWTYKDHEIPY